MSGIAWSVGLTLLVALVVLNVAPEGGALPWTEAVRSDSMAPTLRAGDLAVLRSTDADSVAPGDIILFRDEGGARVLHRVVGGSAEEGWITQGDANGGADPGSVPAGAVVGELVLRLPFAGAALAKLRGPLGIVLLVVLPSAIVLASEGRRILRARRSSQP